MRSFIVVSTLAASLASITGCSPYDPDLGGVPYRCAAAEPKCPEDYTCQDDGKGVQVCVSPNGPGVDANAGMTFQCADDSVLEGAGKNETINTAYATPVAQQRKDISFAGVAICPEGDRDTFLVTVVVANSDLEAVTSWLPGTPKTSTGQPVSVNILNSGGTSIANSQSVSDTSQKAFAANLPVGTYYVQTYAAATAKNNYSIKMTVTE